MPLVTTQPTRWFVHGKYVDVKAGTPVTRPRTLEGSIPDQQRLGLVLGAIQQAARNDTTLVPVILIGEVRLLPEELLKVVQG